MGAYVFCFKSQSSSVFGGSPRTLVHNLTYTVTFHLFPQLITHLKSAVSYYRTFQTCTHLPHHYSYSHHYITIIFIPVICTIIPNIPFPALAYMITPTFHSELTRHLNEGHFSHLLQVSLYQKLLPTFSA